MAGLLMLAQHQQRVSINGIWLWFQVHVTVEFVRWRLPKALEIVSFLSTASVDVQGFEPLALSCFSGL